ncbi:M23 family metallopeptidase [Streptomyces physcomitrii]|uniref:M23 family metallopeptidase n=1 Tax=Streptomyces physcomitrii TaxID=2724184 RepID=A0ABX1H453_9ACTN|nr:M23 family metallopeptidase [Streptomyces physcomitrii]NKI42817.1 M23 family metallopeptidase [Streptomyces physcomitrii]
MAITRARGRHRRPSRLTRTSATAAGVAALTTAGVLGTLASPAGAAQPEPEGSALAGAIAVDEVGTSLAEKIAAQADAQESAADAAAAKRKAEAEAERRAQEAKRKARAERAAEERAARAAERRRLNAYVAPVSGSYVSTGYRTGGAIWSSGSHTGVDFHAASGTPVHAVGRGTVVSTGSGGAYGNEVVLKMHDGTYTQYGHLSSIGVSAGQSVTPGQQLGLSGATGNTTGPHLHFEARTGPDYGSDMDPVAYLRSHGVDL